MVRGEVAAFTRDAFQAPAAAAALTGHSFDAGAAVDRKAGDYRISGQVLVHARGATIPPSTSRAARMSR